MFAKFKIVAPLVALFVACMAVDAAPALPLPMPQSCSCTAHYNGVIYNDTIVGGDADFSQQVCTSLGQANAVFNGTSHACDVNTQSGYDSFHAGCSPLSISDPLGAQHYATTICTHYFPPVPLPTACTCVDVAGINVAAQTQSTCDFLTNFGASMVAG
ncbi:hypothetical protein BGZ98_009815, partial [Dissophora globulifera]